MKIEWQCLKFQALSAEQLFAVLKARQEVFIIEQNCIYPDIDEGDRLGLHVLGCCDGELQLYTRILPAGFRFDEISIGRVLTRDKVRGQGLGHHLLQQTLLEVEREYGSAPIRISAQAHLQAYYEAYGFVVGSKPYDEDGIPHLEMLRKAA